MTIVNGSISSVTGPNPASWKWDRIIEVSGKKYTVHATVQGQYQDKDDELTAIFTAVIIKGQDFLKNSPVQVQISGEQVEYKSSDRTLSLKEKDFDGFLRPILLGPSHFDQFLYEGYWKNQLAVKIFDEKVLETYLERLRTRKKAEPKPAKNEPIFPESRMGWLWNTIFPKNLFQ